MFNSAHRNLIMSEIFTVESYFPDRPPSWVEVFTFAALLPSVAVWASTLPSTSLPAAILGFVGFAILAGPVSQTRIGKPTKKWAKEAGPFKQAGFVALAFIGVNAVFIVETRLTVFTSCFLLGAWVSGALGFVVHILRERRIEGWSPEVS
jgi:hypothetical protein